MTKNTYDITVKGKTLRDFEFIVGPMVCVSIPQPPRQPEEFILASFDGGATPIVGLRHMEVNACIEDIRQIKKKMGDRYFGVNVLGIWRSAPDIINGLNELGNEGPDFLDINAVEQKFDTILPLLKNSKLPISMGIYQPSSIQVLKKLLLKEEYSFLVDRFRSGMMKLFLPRNRGGGHLPSLIRNHEKIDWLDHLIRETMNLSESINAPIPFIVEKGMMTVSDFVDTIIEYSQYPNFAGIRFASNLLMTSESGLSIGSKQLLSKIVREQQRDMIIPIHSIIASSRFKKGIKVRGGLLIYVVATRIARMIYDIQCNGNDFPQYSRTYDPTVLLYQACKSDKTCYLCFDNCPLEYCEAKGCYDSVCPDSDVDDALIIVSPSIFEIDAKYIGSSVTFVIQDLIEQTLSKIRAQHFGKSRIGQD